MQTTAVRRPRVLADLLPGLWVRDILLVFVAAGFVGALAQITIPFTPVPITGQTLGVLLAGCTLGSRRALASMLVYFILGEIGLPWFAGGTSGWQGPSTGYLFGFILAACVCGFLAERGADRSVLRSVPLMLLGELCIYAVGVPWLYVDLHQSLSWTIYHGFTVFIAGDSIKLAGAAALLPGAWWLAGDRRGR
ncbi:MAG TPA: biotin transporter BioY [Acidimicrobiales bacterium]|nr:biotin transporter BioY [Acidimicrobiales bacterium]